MASRYSSRVCILVVTTTQICGLAFLARPSTSRNPPSLSRRSQKIMEIGVLARASRVSSTEAEHIGSSPSVTNILRRAWRFSRSDDAIKTGQSDIVSSLLAEGRALFLAPDMAPIFKEINL